MATSRFYRAALRCYPSSFRRRYGDDLIAIFEDLRADRGIRVACWRTIVDLIITIPSYRLENVMSEHQAHLTIAALIAMLAMAGIAIFAIGAWPVSLVLLAVAVVLVAGQRRLQAQSLHAQTPNKRRPLLLCASLAMVAFAGLVALYLADIRDDHVGSRSLLVYNIAGLISLASAVVLTIVDLRTHSEPTLRPRPDRSTP